MIKAIKIEELNSAIDIFKDVTEDMINKGIYQWDTIYPDAGIIEKDINNNHAFGYYDKNELIGYISINNYYNKEYETIKWKYTDNKTLIVHRLAVKSNFQGQGFAKKLMLFAESKAKNDGYATIRLDAFSQNPRALQLYKNLNYRYAGDVNFRKGMFYCFEKRIEAL